MRSKFRALLLVLALVSLWLGGTVATAQATDDTPDVPPVLVAGNPKCTDLGYAYGYKPQPEPPPSGVYTFPGTTETVTIDSDGTYFSWTSTLGVDAVIVKAQNANAYKYDPPAESFGDGGLSAPENRDISHIEFCYDFELAASKTANAQYTRTFTWSIVKDADPTLHIGFAGDSFSSDYDVVVDQTVVDSGFGVTGTITVENPSPFAVNFSVSDSVGGAPATVVCPTNTLAANASTTCSYSAGLGSATDGVNTATITSLTAGVGGATASANYDFGDPTEIEGYETINVDDSVQGPLGSASGDWTFPYSDDFACPSDPGVYTNGFYTEAFPNVATIVETDDNDDAVVHLECYIPSVTKTVDTTFTRSWTWDIAKVGDQTDLTLAAGQSFVVNYVVTPTAEFVDTGFGVSGVISVYNPASLPMTVNVADILNDGTLATVDCGSGSTSLTVAAGATGACAYTAAPAGNTATLNTATATINAIGFSFTALVDFGAAAITEVDECIDVTDDQKGPLGTVCANELPKTFEYTLPVGPYDVCGEYAYTNIASFITDDTGATGSSSHTVTVNVPCAGGCTLTQGYWKTHSINGPAPYDDTWAQIGENTIFFLSGKSWYQVLWTAPKGNEYYNLAHQYIAAKLNVLNGAATTPAVDTALASAQTFFNTYSPSSTLTKQQRAQVLAWASTLDQYNNGLIGPGHCDEDSFALTSAPGQVGLYLPMINQ